MGVKYGTFTSAGRTFQTNQPGGYARSASAKGRAGLVSSSNAVILGTAFGGKPGQINWVYNANEANDLCQGSGNLLECARSFFSPGNDLSPQKVGLYRYNTAVQAGAILVEGVNSIIDVKSKDYGILFNQIKYKLEAGTVGGLTKKFTESYKGVENVIDNIGKASFTIQYIGAAATSAMTISATQIAIANAGGVDNITVSFAEYPTIDAIVAYIAAAGGGIKYTCVATTGSPSVDLGSQLDVVTAADIKSAPVPVYANIQAMIDAINNKSYFCSAVLHTAATRTVPLTNVAAYTYFTGGTEGSATTAEFTTALTALAAEDVQLLGMASTDAALTALLEAHVDATNAEAGKRERQAIIPVAAVTIDTAVTEANAKTRYSCCYVYSKHQNYDVNGVLATQGSMHFAAQLLGMAVALNLNEPLTNKTLNMISLTDKPTSSQKTAAIDAGLILPMAAPDGSIRVLRSITGSKLEDLKYVEFSMVREMLYMTRDLRTGAESLYVGKAGTANALVDIDSYCRDKLSTYENELELLISDPADPKGNPGWGNVQIVMAGDAVRIQWKGNVVAPINYIFITNYFDILVQAAA